MRYQEYRRTKRAIISGATIIALAGFGGSPVLAKDAQSYVGAAESYIQKGDLRAAEIEFRNALRQAPQDAHVHALLAQVYLKIGEFASAEREARSARDLGGAESDYLLTLAEAMGRQAKFADIPAQIKAGDRPPELESKVRLALAMAALGAGDPNKSEALLRQAGSIDPDAPGPKLALARQLLRKNPQESENLVEEVLAKNPQMADAILIKGEILILKGDADGAMQRFGDVLAIDPKNQNARLDRARINLRRSEFEKVDSDIDPILKASPQNFAANYLRALENFKKRDFAAADTILDRLSAGFSTMPEGLYFQAAIKYSLGQYGQASDAIAKYVARVPGSPFGTRLAAMIALRRGTPEVAIQFLTTYLAKARPDPATLTLLGNIYGSTGKPALALDQYQKAAALEPEDLALKAKIVASEIDTSAGQKGLEELEQIFTTDSGAPIAGPTLVLTDIRMGRVDKAAQAAEQLVKRDADNPLFQVLLGVAKAAQRDYPAAENIFKSLVDKSPDFVPARTNLALIYVLAGKLDEARKTYQDFLVRHPNETSVLLGLADIAAREKNWSQAIEFANRARQGSPSDPTPGLKLLDLYSAQRDWERAKRLSSELAAQFSSNADVFEARGRALAASGDPDGAINLYRRAFELAPNSAPIVSRYLSLLASAKQWPDYRRVLQSRLDKDPGNRALKAQLIQVESEIDGLDAAVTKAQGFAKNDPTSSVYDIISADLYDRAGKRADAITLLATAASKRPTDDAVTVALSELYYRGGDLVSAETVLRDQLRSRPDATEVRLALADFYIASKKLTPALQEEEQVLAERPNDAAVLNKVAWLYQQQGDLAKAREFAEKAVAVAPASASAWDTLGWILLAQGETEAALARLQAANAATPGNPEIQYHVAVALDRTGRTADALVMLEQLLGSGASFASKAEAEKLLNDLKRG